MDWMNTRQIVKTTKAPLVLKTIGPVGHLTQKTLENDCHQRVSIINRLQLPPSSSKVAFTFDLFSYLYFLLYISPHHCVSIINRLHFTSISPHSKLRVLIMNSVGIYEQHLTNTFCILASNERHKYSFPIQMPIKYKCNSLCRSERECHTIAKI